MTDAIDTVLELSVGQTFTLRGRRFKRSRYGGTSHYEGRMHLPVWNESGREVLITVRATDRIIVSPRRDTLPDSRAELLA